MTSVSNTPDLFLDDVVYRRTSAGQRALVQSASSLDDASRRFLAIVTGHTPLRALIDLGLDESDVRAAITSLHASALIEKQSDESLSTQA